MTPSLAGEQLWDRVINYTKEVGGIDTIDGFEEEINAVVAHILRSPTGEVVYSFSKRDLMEIIMWSYTVGMIAQQDRI